MAQKNRTVIFLGAGASAADGAPMQGQLFSRYFLTQSSGRFEPVLAKFFEGFYGIDVSQVGEDAKFPTFEDVLGMLELALQCDDHYRVGGETWDQLRIRECREHVIFLICTVLAETLGRYFSIGRNWHRELVSRLQIAPIDFISLNYDLLIDNALVETLRGPDYGATFVNRDPRTPEVRLYKLHGSLNWLRCPTCGSLTSTGTEKGASYPQQLRPRCEREDCKGETTPVVIPPTFFKVMDNFHLLGIWHQAYLSLLKARRIVFCGYSLPDADMHVRYLLKRVEVNSGSTPEVVVVNNHEKKTEDDKTAEKERYRRLFCEPAKVVYTNLSFQDFATDPAKVLSSQLEEVLKL